MNTGASSINDPLKKRIKLLHSSKRSLPGKCVLYVMSRDQRVSYNHALIAAQKHAIAKQLPLAVVFCLRPGSATRAREHYMWMLKGLEVVEVTLESLNIPFLLLLGDPQERISGCIRHLEPDAVYFDMNPLRGPRDLQAKLAKAEGAGAMYVVDTHNVVPVWLASDKQEFAARTIRPKIHGLLAEFSLEPDSLEEHPIKWTGPVMKMSELTGKTTELLAPLKPNGQDKLRNYFPPGEQAAKTHLKHFINNNLRSYAELRNDPSSDNLSGLSPYLHFGHLSALDVLLSVETAASADPSLRASTDVLIEEMIVRKELSDNFCYYNRDYDNLSGAPDWAKNTLQKHLSDDREFIYSLEDFEQAKTHDLAWNAAQIQMMITGKMHGYMRMYWAKKVLEWSVSPEEAINTLVYLNDFYSIDGGDPNGYTGIMWSVAGVHDRPWGERPVYGTIRSMVYSGLKRKFNIEGYISQYISG